MSWSASVLTTVSSDTEPTIVLTFDSAKYIFNVGENTTRAFLQSRRNWKKTRGIFLSSIGTQRASGLPGLLMTFADSGLSNLHVTGPSGLLHFMAAMRKYTFRDNLSVNPVEVPLNQSLEDGRSPVYTDENISVYATPIIPHGDMDTLSVDQGIPPGSTIAIDSRTTPQSPQSASKRKRTPSPHHPSKRFVRGPDLNLLSSLSPGRASSTLQDVMNKSDFDPTSLSGNLAQAWREYIVHTMFPGTKKAASTPSGSSSSGNMERAKKKSQPKKDIPSGPKEAPAPKLVRISQPPGFNKNLPVPEHALVGSPEPSRKPTLAYAVVGSRVRGKFDAKKADALGLKAGPLRSKVARGETVSIMVDDGQGNSIERTIKPEDCMGQSECPGAILLLDVPTPSHIPALLSSFSDSAAFAKYRSQDNTEHTLRTIYHMCGKDVLEDDRYKAFMHSFSDKVHHVVASRQHLQNPVTFTSAAYNQLRLNQLDERIFPIPKFTLQAETDISTLSDLPANTLAMQSNLVNDIRPPRAPVPEKLDGTHDLFHPSIASSTPLSLPHLTQQRFEEVKSTVRGREGASSSSGPGRDVTVCTLGTGSAIPSKYRNVSGTLIQIPGYGNILLDAGEGTWGQLTRNFGDEPSTANNVWEILRDLRCIFISHIHGDHHIGLAKILSMRRKLDPLPSEPLYLVANHTVFMYLRDYSAIEDLGFGTPNGVIPVSSDAIHWRSGSFSPSRTYDSEADQRSSQAAAKQLCQSLGLESLTTVDVEHRIKCHGLIVKHKDGWSIVFSGDTVPTNKLVRAGTNATLLIHEATMADDQVEMAKAKMHSTFGQAIGIGKSMKAQNILLTHFSARYPKMPPPSALKTEGPNDPVLALAFDMANIKLGEMWKLSAYMAAIEQSFIDSPEENDLEESIIDTQTDIS
ncbi:hypothetical protein BJ138DRAFT_1151318 [Hygrophoropsis aurantiaca]|uniref:Uncharacterized protein n=1 Tax=Hygrophoropsis aurantiaca TaxID=72124 RepID=A0ACB8ADQ2_9AGAM|nr:hypothetical protein BJ138DRAFT_1151318 [Hygrophoropsis aurantiaca]